MMLLLLFSAVIMLTLLTLLVAVKVEPEDKLDFAVKITFLWILVGLLGMYYANERRPPPMVAPIAPLGEQMVLVPDILEEVQLEMAVPTDHGNVTVVFRLNSRTGDVDIIKIIPMS